MIRKIRFYFLLRDCKKFVTKHWSTHDIESTEFMADILKLLDKYRTLDGADAIIIDTMAIIERRDRQCKRDFIKIIEDVKNESAPSSTANTEQGNETR